MATRPNLVFVFADQMRAFSCGYRGEDPVLTPRLDAFAQEGKTLSHAVSNFPICSPYRAMLMSGQYPLTNGVVHNCNSTPGRTWELRADTTCFTDVLAEAGYSVGYVGKWHLERPREPYVMPPTKPGEVVWNEFTPPERRHGIGYWHGYNTYDNHLQPEYWIGDAGRDERTRIEQWSPEHEADVATAFLKDATGRYRNRDQPFALFVSNNPPHTPFHLVPERYVDRYGDAGPRDLLKRGNVDLDSEDHASTTACRQVKNHFAMVTGVDEQFGRILDTLREEGLEQDTLVVFTSDHGEMMGSHRLMGKPYIWDEAMRVPFIARMQGAVEPGTQDDLLLGAPDVMPTVLGMLGLDDQVPAEVEGRNYAAALRDEACERPGSALYLNCNPAARVQHRGLRTHRHTLAVGSDGAVELYDNADDPYQLRNVAGERTGLVADLMDELQQWLTETGDTFALPGR